MKTSTGYRDPSLGGSGEGSGGFSAASVKRTMGKGLAEMLPGGSGEKSFIR